MKMIKTILKPFLRIIVCLMYVPLFLLSIVYTSLLSIFLVVCAGISMILMGDMDTFPNIIADALEKYENIFCLFFLLYDDPNCIVLNYNTMVFDKINKW